MKLTPWLTSTSTPGLTCLTPVGHSPLIPPIVATTSAIATSMHFVRALQAASRAGCGCVSYSSRRMENAR
jgi:hypothetical protein